MTKTTMTTTKGIRQAERFDSLFRYYARPPIDWQWLRAQARAESGSDIDPRAISSAGAQGLAQFMPATWAEWSKGNDPFNPEHAIITQAAYMNWLAGRLGGDRLQATAAYNCGVGRLGRIISTHQGDWRRQIPRETRTYLDRIERYYKEAYSWTF